MHSQAIAAAHVLEAQGEEGDGSDDEDEVHVHSRSDALHARCHGDSPAVTGPGAARRSHFAGNRAPRGCVVRPLPVLRGPTFASSPRRGSEDLVGRCPAGPVALVEEEREVGLPPAPVGRQAITPADGPEVGDGAGEQRTPRCRGEPLEGAALPAARPERDAPGEESDEDPGRDPEDGPAAGGRHRIRSISRRGRGDEHQHVETRSIRRARGGLPRISRGSAMLRRMRIAGCRVVPCRGLQRA